jgi:hypothetical protein
VIWRLNEAFGRVARPVGLDDDAVFDQDMVAHFQSL